MSATNTYSARAPESGSSATTLNEPSMEDILASIRRIIAEDQSNSLGRTGLTGLTRRSAAAPAESTARADDVAEAPVAPAEPVGEATPTDEPAVAELAAADEPAVAAIDHHADLRQPYGAPEHEEGAHHPTALHEPAHDIAATELSTHPSLDERHETEQVDETYSSDLVPNHEDHGPLISSTAGASITSSFQTLADTMLMQDPDLIERIMRETLRPMLKTWLDDHLPSLVERLVRAEIERVARGGRSRD